MESKNQAVLRKIIYGVVLIVASLPLACGYVMDGGDVSIWLARIEEVKEGLMARRFHMFPSAELMMEHNGQFSALNSNLWLLLPAVMRLAGISVTTAYRIYMLLLNIIALFSVKKMFSSIFADKTTVLLGVLLYMTCPYRVYLCYDKAALGMMAAWAVLPLVLGEMFSLFKGTITWKKMLVAAAAFALAGYADGMLMAITAGIMVLGIIWYRRWIGLLPVIAGGIAFLPGAIYWGRYLLKGGMAVWNLPLQSIASKGYVLGQFFSSYAYQSDCPGLGMGLLIALVLLFWISFTQKDLMIMKKYGFFVVIMCLFTFMSMKVFPWDVVQRLGTPLLRMVGLMETPGICFGFVSLAACVPAAYGMECVSKQKALFLKIGLPLIVVFGAVGVAVYICNTLTYSRVPMFL